MMRLAGQALDDAICKVTGWGHRVPPTSLPIEQVLGEYSTRFLCLRRGVKIRPRKACNYPNLRLFGWLSYDKVGVLHSGKFGNRSEARASELKSYLGLWWKRIKLRL